MAAPFLITLREGVEASLIITILLAYLNRLGRLKEARQVWLGALLAVLVSFLAGVGLFLLLGQASGYWAELAEGFTMWAAVIVLTFVLIWMRRQSKSIGKELQARVDTALGKGAGLALASLAFLAVFREGAETVLFLMAASRTASGLQSIIGGTMGLFIAILLAVVLYRTSKRFHLRVFFDITTVLLLIFAAGMVGRATMNFQALGIFPGTISLWNTSSLLSDTSVIGSLLNSLLGYTASPTVLQVIFYMAYLALILYLFSQVTAVGSVATVREEPFNALRIGYGHWLYRFLRHPGLTRAIPWAMLGLFAFLVVAALVPLDIGSFDNQGTIHWGPFSNTENQNNFFNFLVWVVWLPLVSISTVFLGRFWCGNLCPLRVASDAARRLTEWVGLGKGSTAKPYLRLGWILPVTFILITFFVKSFPVQTVPWMGAVTFIAIFGVATLVGLFFRRGTWCRYFCPIGGWLARITRLSPVALRPQKDVCATCVDKPCLAGTKVASRCPAFLNPSQLDSNRYCLECWYCVKNCPREKASLRLGVRAPAAELMAPHAPDLWEVIFVAGLIGMYAAVAAGPILFPQLLWPVTFFGMIAAAIALYTVVCAVAGWLGGIGLKEALTKFGYAALPLEFGAAIITFGDDSLGFFGIMVPATAIFLGVGFVWSVPLLASIVKNNCRSPRRAVAAAIPLFLALVWLLFTWSKWYLAGTVIDVT